MKIILVRHGETVYNKEGKFQGHDEVPLSEKGKAQAGAVAQRLKDDVNWKGQKVSAIYTSPMDRAMKTAEAIGEKLHLIPKPLPELKEADMGEWSGKTSSEVKEKYFDVHNKPLLARCEEDPDHFSFPGGESLKDLEERVTSSVNKIIQGHKADDTVVIVTHGGPVGVLLAHVLGKPLTSLRRLSKQENASIRVVKVEKELDDGKLIVTNPASHLDDLDYLVWDGGS